MINKETYIYKTYKVSTKKKSMNIIIIGLLYCSYTRMWSFQSLRFWIKCLFLDKNIADRSKCTPRAKFVHIFLKYNMKTYNLKYLNIKEVIESKSCFKNFSPYG